MNNISKLNLIFIFNFIILIFAFNALAIDRNIPKTNVGRKDRQALIIIKQTQK